MDSAVECLDSWLDGPPALLKECQLVVIEEGPQAIAWTQAAWTHAAEFGTALLDRALLGFAR